MNIVLLESLGISKNLLDQLAAPVMDAGHNFRTFEKSTNPVVQMEQAADADVVILANMILSGEVISACKNLKFIDIAFTGVDHVDLETAKAAGIKVSNASGYSNQAVAELVICMALSLLRNISQAEECCRQEKTKEGLIGSELRGKTVGIIGTGVIGCRTAELFSAFGCRILGYRRHVTGKEPAFIEHTPLEDLLSRSDIVSLHCPINEESKNLMNRERIHQMKKGAYLINAARGPVVDSEALANALNEDWLAGAGIDVFETEPPLPSSHVLLHSKNTLVTPHVAFATEESMEARARIVFQNLEAFLKGGQDHVIL